MQLRYRIVEEINPDNSKTANARNRYNGGRCRITEASQNTRKSVHKTAHPVNREEEGYELYRFISILVTEKAKKAATVAAPAVDEEEIKRRAIEEYLKAQAAQATEPAESTENNSDEN